MTTVRELVRDIQTEVRDTRLTPERAGVLLLRSAALIGHCNEQIRLTDAAYRTVLGEKLATVRPLALAHLQAEQTDAYAATLEARDAKELVQELVRALKSWLHAMGGPVRPAQ